jgi:hypothetical protein
VLQRYVARVRAPRPRRAYLRVEVDPGEQAHVDWGQLFNNTAAAATIADRPVHNGLLIKIAGKSRRSDREVPM